MDTAKSTAAERYMQAWRPRVDQRLDELLPRGDGPAATVVEAMRYAVLGGGKRLRPILALAGSDACGGDPLGVLSPACAIEMIHAYSLVHDDLPAMDDDDLRRGRPTLHKAFGEAVAVLAGDALHTLAFEVLVTHPEDGGSVQGSPAGSRSGARVRAALAVARAAGVTGMVGGQIADLEAERRDVTADEVHWIHAHKTGALLAASLEVGAIHAAADPRSTAALVDYGHALGLAFQIADDLLDETSTAEALGKTPGKDHRAGKATYPAILGIERARVAAEASVEHALAALARGGIRSPVLEDLAAFSVARTS